MSTARSRGRGTRHRVLRVLAAGEAGVILALVILCVTFQLIQPAFGSAADVRAILSALSYLGIISVGQIILLIGGEFDLSVGSTAGLSAIVAADLMAHHDIPVAVAVLGGLLVGALIGLVNGVVVVRLRIPAFIATLGMLFVAQGATQVITDGQPIYPLPQVVSDIGQATPLFGLGWSFAFFVVVAILGDLFLRVTVPGRTMYAVGGNPVVARLSGVRVERYKIGAFVLSGTLAAAGGLFLMGNLGSGTTSIGQGWELLVIAGVVVGGVSLFGGVGSVVGGAVGMLLLQVVQSGLVVVGISPNWQTIAVGSIMVLAVGLDVWRRRLPDTEPTEQPTATAAASAPAPEAADRAATGET
ncbi:ABC transporter permease [Nakamurella endophytica]|uniref:Autoinducer 2 import system permease protein LsrD n=1 Tax=Nakamurella endophytica TaxID=1748367 RepID=A0A917T8Q0_9ACTN|nr:ABC transporter permease [Nakamurella endophytica]GGM14631.1 sugar ABC transporter permease [Nakamurella endophytica]